MTISQKDCPTSKEERKIEQMQQMFNLDEEWTSLNMLATDMHMIALTK